MNLVCILLLLRSTVRLAGLLIIASIAVSACSSGAAIVGAKIYPSPDEPAIEDGVILISGGRIRAVGPRSEIRIPDRYERLDRSGDIAVAGFWNNHAHPVSPALADPDSLTGEEIEAALFETFAKWGFTTIVDIASATSIAIPLKNRIDTERLATPRLLTVGDPFYPKDGTPIYARPIYEALGLPSAEITTAEEAVARLNRQAEAGVDAVKLFTGAIVGGEIGVLPMPGGQVRALADAADKRNLPVFAHSTNMQGLKAAVENGADILAHASPLSGEWSADYAAHLVAEGVALAPTLHLFEVHPASATPVHVAQQQVRALAQAGGDIMFGTDAGFMEVYDTAGEFRLMSEVLNWRQILSSLTTVPARRFGEEEIRGRIARGMIADIVILDQDPADDPVNFSRVTAVIRDGRIIYSSDHGARH